MIQRYAPRVNKNLLIIAIIIIVIVVAVLVRYLIKNADKKDDTTKTAENEIQKNELTFEPYQYNAMSDKLFRAMSGTGTDENAIYSTLQTLQTSSDWFALVVAFGVRETGAWWSGFTGNLVEWLIDELDQKELTKVNDILTRINVRI